MARSAAQVAQRCQVAQENGKLDLSGCELTKFPDGVFMLMQATPVVSLNVSRNCLKVISPKIPQRWSQVQDLDVTSNELRSLPDELQNLTNLRTLHLRGNHFTHIPLVVYTLGNLQTLVASYNQIDAVAAEEMKSMSSLKHVDLRENPLSDALKSQLAERDDWELLI